MKSIHLISIFIFLFGCHPIRQLLKTNNGYYKLPDKEYTLKYKVQPNDQNLLSTTNTYLCCRCSGRTSGFLKFFDDGKVLEATTYQYESGKIDTSYKGGYYLFNENKLLIELPEGSQTAFSSSWGSMVYNGRLINDTIEIDKARWHGKVNDKHKLITKDQNGKGCNYVKSKEIIIFKSPDW